MSMKIWLKGVLVDCNKCINRNSKCVFCKHVAGGGLDFYDNGEVIESSKGVNKNYKGGIRAERIISNRYGGKLVVASGALTGSVIGLSGDVVFPQYNLLVQSKTKTKPGPQQDEIRINKNWIVDHWDICMRLGRIPSLFFSFYANDNFWAIFNDDTITDCVEIKATKSVMFTRDMVRSCPLSFKFEGDDTYFKVTTVSYFLDTLRNSYEN